MGFLGKNWGGGGDKAGAATGTPPGASPNASDEELWADFRARPADYQALAAQLGLLPDEGERVHGDLPEEIVAAIRGMDLDTRYLAASLRGYQDFAARFALVQKKVLIGDEMGLGKTIEALAALTHLHAEGRTHFLVVCPAAVVSNWIREVESKSRLEATYDGCLTMSAADTRKRPNGSAAPPPAPFLPGTGLGPFGG